jgi:hypothetical protein
MYPALRTSVSNDGEGAYPLGMPLDPPTEVPDTLRSENDHEAARQSRANTETIEVDRLRRECDELRARIRELEYRLENMLERERTLDAERIDMTRNAAAAVADAQRELERLAAAQPEPLLRKGPRGNWLR